jgi:F1F0 ATPase subunit 2
MDETLLLGLALLGGIGLGAIFFGGLWWTVRNGTTAPNPALWFFGSLVVRMSIVLGGLYHTAAYGWQPLLACLLGLVLARGLVIRLTRAGG